MIMATISENLQTIKDSTDAIKQAIIDKGGTINGDITTWASAISGIETGGESSGDTSYLICRCNYPNPRTGEPRYTCVVFTDIYPGDTWRIHINRIDLSERAELKTFTLHNGAEAIAIDFDYIYSSQDPIALDDVIDTNNFYEFIYG